MNDNSSAKRKTSFTYPFPGKDAKSYVLKSFCKTCIEQVKFKNHLQQMSTKSCSSVNEIKTRCWEKLFPKVFSDNAFVLSEHSLKQRFITRGPRNHQKVLFFNVYQKFDFIEVITKRKVFKLTELLPYLVNKKICLTK